MTQTSLDYYIFILEDKDLIITVYINDLLIIRINFTRIINLKMLLINKFKILDIEVVLIYLSIEIKRRQDGILLY